jgi:MoaA/NifB/PqqE/SkfB family radical SAM enzyme
LNRLLDCAKLQFQQHTHRLSLVPIVVLYLNNVCDSRCITCSIWKNNDTLRIPAERQMSDELLNEVHQTIREWRPRQVLLSGGEPALHPRFSETIRKFASLPSSVCVVTNGLLLGSLDRRSLENVSEFYISFDAPDRESYGSIRGVDGFDRLIRSVAALRSLAPHPKIVARCTLQRSNVGLLKELVKAAKQIGFDTISFLGVDVGSPAFSRDRHGLPETHPIQPAREDLILMRQAIQEWHTTPDPFIEGGISRLERILQYFRALVGETNFPSIECNAPWVSTVIETTGKIRGCFFQPVIGDFRTINGETAVNFRRSLDVATDNLCSRCVCSKRVGPWDFIRM